MTAEIADVQLVGKTFLREKSFSDFFLEIIFGKVNGIMEFRHPVVSGSFDFLTEL